MIKEPSGQQTWTAWPIENGPKGLTGRRGLLASPDPWLPKPWAPTPPSSDWADRKESAADAPE